MRNLTFLASPAIAPAAASFRRSFMEKTASWSVAIEECHTRGEAAVLLSAKRSHAFVVSAQFRQAVFEAGKVQGASARLAQGADILYRSGKNTLALSQYARVAIDEMERLFLPLYGAKAVVLGSGSSALDVVYECARAGVSEITLLGAEKERTRNNLLAFLEAFGKERTQIIDTEQKRVGHLSATRAYDNASFLFGTVAAASRIASADLVFCAEDFSQAGIAFGPGHIVCDLCGESTCYSDAAIAAGCDYLATSSVMAAWGAECAELLVEFGRAEL